MVWSATSLSSCDYVRSLFKFHVLVTAYSCIIYEAVFSLFCCDCMHASDNHTDRSCMWLQSTAVATTCMQARSQGGFEGFDRTPHATSRAMRTYASRDCEGWAPPPILISTCCYKLISTLTHSMHVGRHVRTSTEAKRMFRGTNNHEVLTCH